MDENDAPSYWFDTGPLTRGASQDPGGNPGSRPGFSRRLSTALGSVKGSAQHSDVIAEFAAANRLEYQGSESTASGDRRTSGWMLKEEGSSDVVSWPGPLYVEFGNNGSRYGVGEGGTPSRRGYVAVRHDLGLPYAFLQARGFGPLTPMNALSVAWEVLGDLASAAEETTPARRSWGQKLEVDRETAKLFHPYCRAGQEPEVRELLSEEALPILREIATSFDVHVTESWLFLYSYYGDVSTLDPDVWAWVFSVASRMLDLVEVWHEVEPSRRDADAAGSHRDLPFYTSRHIERPSKLDGSLKVPKRST